MFKSVAVPLLWQAERINIYLAGIPLIYLPFFHVVAVSLAATSDLCAGSVWISGASVKGLIPGLFAEVEGLTRVGLGAARLGAPRDPGGLAQASLAGEVESGQAVLWPCPGVTVWVTVEASHLLWEKEFSLNPCSGFFFFFSLILQG